MDPNTFQYINPKQGWVSDSLKPVYDKTRHKLVYTKVFRQFQTV